MAAAEADAPLSRIELWFAARGYWIRALLAFASGALATLGHAPFNFALAYGAAIVVLVWLLDAASRKPRKLSAAFSTGFWFGLGHFVTGFYWIASAFLVDAQTWGLAPGVAAAFALSAGLAPFWAVGCAVAMVFWTHDMRRIPIFAVAITLTEWLRGNILSGFPWLLPGYIWTPGEPVSQIASLVTIYGLTAITLLVAAAPAAIADRRFSAGWRFAPMVAAGLVLGMLWGWGEQRLAGARVDPPGAQPIVRVADAGLSQAEKWQNRPDQEWRVLSLYLDASGPPDQSEAQVLVWPEGAIPVVNFFTLENPEFLGALGAGLGDRVLIAGVTRREARDGRIAYFNSAAIIDGVSGMPRVAQVYDKHHLVPWGEYIPLWSVLQHLNLKPLQQIGAGFDPGPAPTRLVVPDAPPAVVLICYEAIFPGMIPRGAERPGWIVSVTNDAWFGDLRWFTGPWQHFQMARYRAIEEGLPMARSASGGVSAIIDAYGRVVRQTRPGVNYAEAQLPPALNPPAIEITLPIWRELLSVLLVALIATLRFVPARALRGRDSV